MSSSKWTKEQLLAINLRGCDMLVAAAAGSGKTAVLVERIIKIITDVNEPIDIDRLLVVTFTNAAAAEMRQRIGEALSKKLEENPEYSNIQKQLALLNKAQITTIHSFCLNVIRNNCNVLGIDPAFRIADENEIELLKADALDSVFEKYYSLEENNDFFSLIESYGENTKDTKLRELILNIYSFIQGSPFPEKWIDDMAEKFNISESEILDDSFWGGYIKKELEFELKGILETSKKALEIIHLPDGPLEYEKSILEDLCFIENLISALNVSLEFLYSRLYEYKFGIIGRKKKESSEELQKMVSSLRDDVKSSIGDIKEKILFSSPDEMKKYIIKLYPVLKALSKVVLEFSNLFQEMKKEKQIVDFNDLEHYCLKVLLDEASTEEEIIPSKAAMEYQKQFAEILIDEYQDSNLVQEMILTSVSGVFSGHNNRFMVGDVKQSIYRFRLAMPELFMKKYDSFSNNENESQRRIDLYKNFRSRENILNGINFIFKQVMNRDVGDITYDDNASLHPGAGFPEFMEEGGCWWGY